VRIPKGLQLGILEVLQIQGLSVGNFGQKPVKHGVGLEVRIIKNLPRILDGYGSCELKAPPTKTPASEGGHYNLQIGRSFQQQ